MESHVLKLGSRPLASKTKKIKGEISSAITRVKHNHTCKWCPRCGHGYETYAKYAEHPCEKILVSMKSCFVKLDKLYHVSQKLKSKQVSVKPSSNDVAMAEIKGNNTSENNWYCSRCGTEYKTFAEYTKHPCEKILAGMQACVVQLDCFTFPSGASPEWTNLVSSASLSKPSSCTII